MAVLSKHLIKLIENETCKSFVHPNETCTQQFFKMVTKNVFLVAQFYLPTLVIPLLLQIKSLNRDRFKQALIDYGKCILIGYWLSIMIYASICVFYKIFGKFHFSFFFNGAITIGTLMFHFYPERIKRWQTTGLFNLLMETKLRTSNNDAIKLIRKSSFCRTLIFMFFSGVIMAGFKITGLNRFWFISLPKPSENSLKPAKMLNQCGHDGMCTNHIWKEFSKSTKVALVLGLLKFTINNYKRINLKQPGQLIKLLLQKIDYNVMAFTMSYNTLFHLLGCWFNNITGDNNMQNTMAAGFISGISFGFYPIYTVFTFGLTASLQMGWFMYTKYIQNCTNDSKLSDRNNNDFIHISKRFIDFINKLPIATISMTLSIIQLFQYRLEYPYATPIYVHNFLSLITDKRTDQAGLRASEFLLGLSQL